MYFNPPTGWYIHGIHETNQLPYVFIPPYAELHEGSNR